MTIAAARVRFGIGPVELGRMTLHQFSVMVDMDNAMDRPRNSTIELMVAQLIAMVGNTGFRSFKNTLKPVDFMPSRTAQSESPKRTRRRPQKEVFAELRASLDAAFGKG